MMNSVNFLNRLSNIIPKAIFVFAVGVKSSILLADTLTVHEWGTFTTLSSSTGTPLSGLYKDETRLPGFVHGLPFFNYDSSKGWPSTEQVKNVTVKMETPVLYFYSDKEREIEAEVAFKGGSISQWYPQRESGESNPTGKEVDFATGYNGSIRWKGTVLKNEGFMVTSSPPELESQEWRAPRNTLSNYIRGQYGEIEKFLFYRGIGNFETGFKTVFNSDGSLTLTNANSEAIKHVMVYEFSQPEIPLLYQDASIWWEGSLGRGASVIVRRKKTTYVQVTEAIERLRTAMVQDGLFPEESHSLLDTWQNSYFTPETGLKVFWLLPKSKINEILPLKLTPAPQRLERVIIGRSEVLTPEFEAKLIADYKNGTLDQYAHHRYFSAYLNLLATRGFRDQAVSIQSEQRLNNGRTSILASSKSSSSIWNFQRNEADGSRKWFNAIGQNMHR